jgi:hypothetical protein
MCRSSFYSWLGVVYYLAMARDQAIPTPISQPRAPAARDGEVSAVASRIREIGYRSLLILAFALPFDMRRRPLLWTNYVSITNLTVLLLAAAAWAMVTIAGVALDALRGSQDAAGYFSRQRLPLALLIAFLISSAISTALSPFSTGGLSWFLSVLTGALIWLALPLWLAGDTETKVNRLGMAIVAGAIVASIVGFIEILVGTAFDQHLLLFKFGPATMGPFLRLSSTFSSANVTAMYFEVALPFALVGLVGALDRRSHRGTTFIIWLAAIDILLVALVLTYSRGALLGLLAAGLAMVAAGRGGWRLHTAARWRWPVVVVAVNLALVLGFFAFSSSPIELLRFSTQNDRAWYQAAYVSTVPTTMVAGKTRTIAVTVENRSPLRWDASSPHTYGLSYHWLHPSWKVVRFANPITWLSSDLRPDDRQTVQARVTAPRRPGKYLLIWDMIWKSTTWFGPRTGLYQASPVRVIEPKALVGVSASSTRIPQPDITDLPTAPALDRAHIWAVAVTMIEKRPLFGLGPQGVRMNYAAFAPPDHSARVRNPPPHAHNLALEMLADWGIIGSGLFAGLLVALWWPLLQRVRRGHVESRWELAVVGVAAALVGHEFVDYFLTKQAIFAVLWLLCGLAATMSRIAPAGGSGSRRA